MEKKHTDRILWGKEGFRDRTATIQGLKVNRFQTVLENDLKEFKIHDCIQYQSAKLIPNHTEK